VNEWRAESSVLTEIPQEHKAFIESRDAQMPDLYIEGVAGRRRRTDSYPKHVDQADRRLDWREVITRGVSESGSAHHATWLLDRSIAEANEREYRKEARLAVLRMRAIRWCTNNRKKPRARRGFVARKS
jgi:hypothetical protein